MAHPRTLAFGLVGYGEVGKIFTAALVERKAPWVGAWDVLLARPVRRRGDEGARAIRAASTAVDVDGRAHRAAPT